MTPLKILQICFRLPYPPHDGGAIAMYNMAKGLKANGCELTMLSYNTKKHFFDPDKLPASFKVLGELYTVDLDASVKPLGAFLNLFGRKSYNIIRFDQQKVREELAAVLESKQFDIIHFEGLFTSMYVDDVRRLAPKSKLVLRQHNIEYKIWERMAKAAGMPKKWYLNLLAKRLKRYELNVFHKFDAIIPITEVDERDVKATSSEIKTFVSPTGVDVSDYVLEEGVVERNSVFHFGSLNWMPNQEGLKWFLESTWPIIRESTPEAKFFIAGKDMPDWIGQWHGKDNVEVVGEVEDAVKFYNSKNIMVVPLLSGSGMRIKIIEGMAAGKAIISTKIGAEGISVKDGKEVLLRDDAQSFAEAVVGLLENEEHTRVIGQNARKLVEDEYSNVSRVKDLIEFYKRLLS